MKKLLFVTVVAVSLIAVMVSKEATSQEIKGKDCIFHSSLHYTANGMQYWYSKENGGLETVTGIPFSKLTCKNCHVSGCDKCHKVEKDGKARYSTKAAGNQSMCLKCHGRQKKVMTIDDSANQQDIHFSMDMECMDCHTQREMHGDGIEYVSHKQLGAMDTKCENCHDDIKPTDSHTVHKEKLDCKACHVRHVVSCTNCHFDTLVNEGKRAAIPVSGWVFLMNHRGKVSSATMQTFVVNGNKTFLMFAPRMSHSVMKDGRSCDDCHGAKNMKQVQEGQVTLTWFEDGKVNNLKGIIPVVDGVDYKCVYLDRKEGEWIPIKDPAKPVYQYVAFSEPLSKKQLESLVKVQEVP